MNFINADMIVLDVSDVRLQARSVIRNLQTSRNIRNYISTLAAECWKNGKEEEKRANGKMDMKFFFGGWKMIISRGK